MQSGEAGGQRRAIYHIGGIVQGVGFRPFIYGLATRLGLKGWVRNTSAGVDIEVDGEPDLLERFAAAIQSGLPPLARVDSFKAAYGEPGGFTTFEIIHSEAVEGAFLPVSPDVCICADCLRELFDPADRRYRYPFINCTNCGPRFTIIKDIPYDRPNTTMATFPMCPECAAEYQDPLDRRFHAQPVACPACGPKAWLELKEGGGTRTISGDDAFRHARRLLREGRILAVKGLGGFHLACDATNAGAVAELRRRKLRVDKPFALMMLDCAAVGKHCHMGEGERQQLETRQRPVVLLVRKHGSTVAEEAAPRQDTLGVMLPYTPLHYLLLTGEEEMPPLVMTSGNLSEEPIATGNEEARERLGTLADAFLMHDRDIWTRCDDSVLRVHGAAGGKDEEEGNPGSPYLLRRSRGFAPDPIRLPRELPPGLAVGPELKNTFCLTRGEYAFVSHHIGDMENYETLRSFEQGIEAYERLFHIRPGFIVHDLHPDYLSTRYARKRAGQEDLPVARVQHHHAHIAACMAENGLDGSRKVIGLSFDGTGLGTDGTIWGGEVLLADYAGFERRFHLGAFPLPGGDAATRRPAKIALALLWSLGMEWEQGLASFQELSQQERLALRMQLERKLNTPMTSSMGRLFDAAAALAGGRQRVNYEAQAAMEFEACLDERETGHYPVEIRDDVLDPLPLVSTLLGDVRKGVNCGVIAARFHNGVAEMAKAACEAVRTETGIEEAVLSGGVWQNMRLLRRVEKRLQAAGFKVTIHRKVPTNDGGIALGQAVAGAAQLKL